MVETKRLPADEKQFSELTMEELYFLQGYLEEEYKNTYANKMEDESTKNYKDK